MGKHKKDSKISAIIFLLSFLAIIFSCEKKTDWNLNPSQEQFLIVDGIITNELKNHTINLSLSFQNLNDTIESASGAEVTVSDGDNTFNFFEDTVPGIYFSDTQFTGVINKRYTLNIEYQGKNYSSDAKMSPVSLSNPLPYKQVQDTNLYYIASETAVFNPSEASMYEVLLDWSNITGYENLPAHETSALMYFYNITTIDVGQIFAPDKQIVLFPHGTSMTQKKYSLSPEHEKFIRSLLIESQWHGGNFDIEEGNVYTNLSEGALGFFGACSVISYSATIE